VFFISGFVLGVAGSIVMIAGAEWGLYLVTVCYVSSLIATVWNAWAITLGIARGKRKTAR